ncbi:MAG: hypothetical protein ABI675_04995 [Chitinophagaceae bacterium]
MQSLSSFQNDQQSQETAGKKNNLDYPLKNIILHHLHYFRDNDLEAILPDYTNESAPIRQDVTSTGKEEIRSFTSESYIHFLKQNAVFEWIM